MTPTSSQEPGGISVELAREVLASQPFSRLLRARAAVVTTTRRRAVCRCEVVTVDETGAERVCAVAQGSAIAVDSPAGEVSPPAR